MVIPTHKLVLEALTWKVQLIESTKSYLILLEFITTILWKYLKAIVNLYSAC